MELAWRETEITECGPVAQFVHVDVVWTKVKVVVAIYFKRRYQIVPDKAWPCLPSCHIAVAVTKLV